MKYDIQFEFPGTLVPLWQSIGNFRPQPPSLPSTKSKICPDTKCWYWLTALGVKNPASDLRISSWGWQLFEEREFKKNIREGGVRRKVLKNYGYQGALILSFSILKWFSCHLLSLISLALGIGLMFPVSFFHSPFWQVFLILSFTVRKKSVQWHGLFLELNSRAIWSMLQ